jgi:hypothetical protein
MALSRQFLESLRVSRVSDTIKQLAPAFIASKAFYAFSRTIGDIYGIQRFMTVSIGLSSAFPLSTCVWTIFRLSKHSSS